MLRTKKALAKICWESSYITWERIGLSSSRVISCRDQIVDDLSINLSHLSDWRNICLWAVTVSAHRIDLLSPDLEGYARKKDIINSFVGTMGELAVYFKYGKDLHFSDWIASVYVPPDENGNNIGSNKNEDLKSEWVSDEFKDLFEGRSIEVKTGGIIPIDIYESAVCISVFVCRDTWNTKIRKITNNHGIIIKS